MYVHFSDKESEDHQQNASTYTFNNYIVQPLLGLISFICFMWGIFFEVELMVRFLVVFLAWWFEMSLLGWKFKFVELSPLT